MTPIQLKISSFGLKSQSILNSLIILILHLINLSQIFISYVITNFQKISSKDLVNFKNLFFSSLLKFKRYRKKCVKFLQIIN